MPAPKRSGNLGRRLHVLVGNGLVFDWFTPHARTYVGTHARTHARTHAPFNWSARGLLCSVRTCTRPLLVPELKSPPERRPTSTPNGHYRPAPAGSIRCSRAKRPPTTQKRSQNRSRTIPNGPSITPNNQQRRPTSTPNGHYRPAPVGSIR